MKSYAMEIFHRALHAKIRQKRGDCFHLENPENGEMEREIFSWQGKKR